MLRYLRSFSLLACLCAPTQVVQASAFWISTGQTGGETQLDLDHAIIFVSPKVSIDCPAVTCTSFTIPELTPTTNFDLAGGLFIMRDASETFSGVAFRLYEMIEGQRNMVAQITYPQSSFDLAHPGENSQTFDVVPFVFETPFTMLEGHDYWAELVSGTSSNPDEAYFVQGPGLTAITDSQGTPMSDGSVATPEGGTAVMLATGLILILLSRTWKKKQQQRQVPSRADQTDYR